MNNKMVVLKKKKKLIITFQLTKSLNVETRIPNQLNNGKKLNVLKKGKTGVAPLPEQRRKTWLCSCTAHFPSQPSVKDDYGLWHRQHLSFIDLWVDERAWGDN